MALIQLTKLKNSNLQLSRTGLPGEAFSTSDINETIRKDLDVFAKDVIEARSTARKSASGRQAAPSIKSFTQLLEARYGLAMTKDNASEGRFWAMNQYLKMLGVESDSFSLTDMAQTLGFDLNGRALEQLLTTEIATGTTFIIREVIVEAIRLGMLGINAHGAWISRVQPISDEEITMPQILKGEGTPKILGEGESIPYGSVQFGQKKVGVEKVGIGFELTDEIMNRSSIDMLQEFIMTVGEDMGLAEDTLAADVLINGEQADLSESAPVIGSESGTGIAWIDILRVIGKMRRLGNVPSTTLSRETVALSVAQIAEYQGGNFDTRLANFSSIFGAIPPLTNWNHGIIPANHLMFIAPGRAMNKLQYRNMMVERRRNPRTQKEEYYVSDHVGFAIIRRDARILVDGGTAFSGAGFPSYMDVDTYVNNPFKV